MDIRPLLKETPMPTTGPMIAEGATRFRKYAERLATGVQPHQFARKPTWGLGGIEINTNHAAWNYGHLATYFSMVIESCGLKPEAAALAPAGFKEIFQDGTNCVDDPAGTTYPPMEKILSTFFKAYDAALAALEKADDKVLAAAPTDEKIRANWKTNGARAMFLMTNHVAMHMGQVSTWRRAMGLPAA